MPKTGVSLAYIYHSHKNPDIHKKRVLDYNDKLMQKYVDFYFDWQLERSIPETKTPIFEIRSQIFILKVEDYKNIYAAFRASASLFSGVFGVLNFGEISLKFFVRVVNKFRPKTQLSVQKKKPRFMFPNTNSFSICRAAT